jgi:hypothetical protein
MEKVNKQTSIQTKTRGKESYVRENIGIVNR